MWFVSHAVTYRNIDSWQSFAIPGSSGQHIYHGWPVVWSESQQAGDSIHDSLLPGPVIWTDSGPIEFKGRNLGVPLLLLVLAVCLPPVVADCLTRHRGADQARAGPSVSIRIARASLLGAVIGLTMAVLELETTTRVFRLRDSGFRCAGGRGMGPAYFVDRTIYALRPRPVVGRQADGTPIYGAVEPWVIVGTESYRRFTTEARSFRHRLTGEMDPLNSSPDEWPWPEDQWKMRSRWTWTGAAFGAFLGCLLFRPWRRVTSDSPTTRPAGSPAIPANGTAV
jgi:hypothetical protein